MLSASNLARISDKSASVNFEDKIAFLCAPESYRERTSFVTLLQTHHAWVFITDRHVFKMKKPFRQGGLAYSSLESRHKLCTEEYRLNRRLAKNTYLGVVPLVINGKGELEVDAEGSVVEWLVKMVRLPESRTLLVAASLGRLAPADIQSLIQKLLRFYRRAPLCHFEPDGYSKQVRQKLARWRQELLRPEFGMPEALVNEVTERQSLYIKTFARLLDQRQHDGNVRELHGDLRPEHVFFIENAEPEIIDCLEFDAELRRLDCARELAFLAMECRHAGFEWIEQECIDCYRINAGQPAMPPHLWNFYAALGATIRAGLSAWRLLDSPAVVTWSRQAVDYLHDAQTLHHIVRNPTLAHSLSPAECGYTRQTTLPSREF